MIDGICAMTVIRRIHKYTVSQKFTSLTESLGICMRYRDVSIRKITAVRHLGFLKLNFNSRAVQKHFFCVIVPDFMEVGHTVADIS